MSTKILAISTEVCYTAIAISEDENIIYQYEIDHSKEDFLLLDNTIDQLLGLGAGNKHTLRHRKLHIAELGLAQHILHRAATA